MPKSMSATHAGSTSGVNLCHLFVRRARNVAMSKSVALVVLIRLVSPLARGSKDQQSLHPVTTAPHPQFVSRTAAAWASPSDRLRRI